MNQKNLILIVVIIVCVAASAFIYLREDGAKKQKRRDLADELAVFVTKEMSASTKGRLLILAPPDSPRDPFPGQLATRAEKHLRDAGFEPIEVERVPYNVAMEGSGEPVTRDVFIGLLNAHPDAKTVLSLVGIPRLSGSDLPAQDRPRIIVASTVIMPYLATLPPGLIDFSIEVKHDIPNDTRSDPALGELGSYFVIHRFSAGK